jgi:integrase/recombinase XerC
MVKITIAKRRGRWVVDYYVGAKRHRPSFATKAEAEELKRELILRMQGLGSVPVISQQTSIKDAIHRYYETETKLKGEDAPTTERTHFSALYDFMLDELKLYLVSEIAPEHLRQLQVHLKKTRSGSTVNRYFNTYRHFFSTLLNWGLIAKNPSDGVSNLPVNAERRALWTQDEMALVLGELPKWASRVFLFVSTTGVRSGREVKRITWGDVDFERAQVKITSLKGRGEAISRWIPIPNNCLAMLDEMHSEAKKEFRAKKDDVVFLNSLGNPVESDVLAKQMRRACKKLGIENKVAYGLRHTFCTELTIQNVNLEQIRKLAGHASLKTTQNYLSVQVEQLRDVVDKTSARSLHLVASGRDGLGWTPPSVTTVTRKCLK